MDAAKTTELIKAISSLVTGLSWPLLVLFVVVFFGKPLKKFLSDIGEFTFKAGTTGLEATAKRQIEAAALGAAAAKTEAATQQPAIEEQRTREIAAVVTESVKPKAIRKLSEAVVLWVDDNPNNNVYERRALEALSIEITLSTSTEDALEKVRPGRYAAVISDMKRGSDSQAGFTLLEELRKRGDTTPFILYAGSRASQLRVEAKRRGAFGCTNNPEELFQLVLKAAQE